MRKYLFIVLILAVIMLGGCTKTFKVIYPHDVESSDEFLEKAKTDCINICKEECVARDYEYLSGDFDFKPEGDPMKLRFYCWCKCKF